MLVILMGKSAVGKDSVLKEFVKHGYTPIVSTTTRQMRDGEIPDVTYHYTDKDSFQKLIDAGKMIEYVCFNGNYYGIQAKDIDTTKNQVVVLEPNGIRTLLSRFERKDVFVVNIELEDATRKKLAKLRGSFDETAWAERLKADNAEFTDETVHELSNMVLDLKPYLNYGYGPANVTEEIMFALGCYTEQVPDNQHYFMFLENTNDGDYTEPPCWEYRAIPKDLIKSYEAASRTYYDEDDIPF